ncbi:cell cycle checkpoint protein rad17 [Anaeramoeba flamelloides]|uniref:Cell cycle checkpoint protein rad17 n=1 Tax=Anaeramoeba flamelloides TaxID=1746091 RepID=A0AAV7ZAU3_9EUKA|nr:cell cycle checkpoint protein rad17 [Anaeramoeba flamelloides]
MSTSKTKKKTQKKAINEKKKRRSNRPIQAQSLLQKKDQNLNGNKKGNVNQFSRSETHLKKNQKRVIQKQSKHILNQKKTNTKKTSKNIRTNIPTFKQPTSSHPSFQPSQQTKLKSKTNTKTKTKAKAKTKTQTKKKINIEKKTNKQDQKKSQQKIKQTRKKQKLVKQRGKEKSHQQKPISLRFTSRSKSHMKKPKINLNNQLTKQRSGENNKLFLDKYAPICEGDLSIHSGKRKAVKNWLNYCFSLTNNRYSRNTKGQILILSGPVGCGKTALVRALCSDLNCEIAEWREPIDSSSRDENYNYHINPDSKLKSLGQFLSRAQMYQPLEFIVTTNKEKLKQSKLKTQERPLLEIANQKKRRRTHSTYKPQRESKNQNQNQKQTYGTRALPRAQQTHFPRKIILLEELPILVGYEQKAQFNDLLFDHLYRGIFPLVLIVSDSVGFWFPSFSNSRAHNQRNQFAMRNGNGNRNSNNNIRKSLYQNKNNHGVWGLVDKKLLQSQGVTEIKMNPIAPSLLKKTMKKINQAENLRLSETSMKLIIEQSNGDIRQAINILQIISLDLKAQKYGIVSKYNEKLKKMNHEIKMKKKLKNKTSHDFEKTNNDNNQFSRDAGLTIFHSLGKIIYQKRLRRRTPLLKSKATPTTAASTSFEEITISNNFLIDSKEWSPLEFDPENVIERTNLAPSSFLIHLHGNFLTYFEQIEHAAFAFRYLTTADTMITRLWNERNTLIRTILSGISARSIIIANYETMHLKNKQQKYSVSLFHRVKFFEKTKEKNKNKHQISSLFEKTRDKDDNEMLNHNSLDLRNINKRSFVLDLMPYLGRELNYSVNMSNYQRNIINSIGRFPHRFSQKRTNVAQINMNKIKEEIQKINYLDIDDIEEISD